MTKPCYVVTIPLKTELWQEHILTKRLEIARQMYNACLGEVLKRYKRLKNDTSYQYWIKQKPSKERKEAFKQLNQDYGLSEYALHSFVKPIQNYFRKHIDANTSQKIATRVWKAFDKYRYDKNVQKVYFKQKGELRSVEGKTNKQGIRFKENQLIWNGLTIPIKLKKNDMYLHVALLDKVKYCRIIKKQIRGIQRYFVQLILEGIPPKKVNPTTGEVKHPRNQGTVGIDIGTQTIAIVSENEAKLVELAPNVNKMEQEIRLLSRKLDRQRRANNPHKYNDDGTIKRTKDKWIHSKNYLKTKEQLTDIHRKMADVRKQDHHSMANWILSLGDNVKVETMNYKGLQRRAKQTTINEKTKRYNKKKRFGKSLLNKAPALLLTILDNKLSYDNKQLKKIDTYKIKASQYNHFNESYEKKTIGQRWNDFDCGKVQRDLYSAYLIMNVKNNLKEIDKEKCNHRWHIFKMLHDKEIERLKKSATKIASMGM
ncbi:transposase [Bacillus tianshenii]|nr:transposase [Bacillus tianshenii]